jgi:hypothetical protein
MQLKSKSTIGPQSNNQYSNIENSIRNSKMADQKQKGEGDYESARRFNRRSTDFVQNNKQKIDTAAQDAKNALDTPERAELEQAEIEGKKHAKGEDPAVSRP